MALKNNIVPEDDIIVHSFCTFRNTILTATDDKGNTISSSSSGTRYIRGSRRATAFSAQSAAARLSEDLKNKGIHKIHLFLKGMGKGRTSVPKGLQAGGLKIISIIDKTPIPYNGCRPSKRRRV